MTKTPARRSDGPDGGYVSILADLSAVIEEARGSVARTVNATMTAAYWLVGRRIVEQDQAGQARAAYGTELLVRLAEDLTNRFGRGFSRQNLQQMRQFYQAYSSPEICQTPSGESRQIPEGPNCQTTSGELVASPSEPPSVPRLRMIAQRFTLPWSAYVRLLSVRNVSARHFYLNYAREHWTHADENPPVGLILCAQKDAAVAHYALDGLPNQVMAAEYRTALPDEKELAAEIERTQAVLEQRGPSLPEKD